MTSAKNAHARHLNESERGNERALKTTDPKHKNKHSDAAKQHTEIASGAADMSVGHSTTRGAAILAALSKWAKRQIKISEVDKFRYSVLEHGGKIAALAMKFGSATFTVTQSMASSADVTLDGLFKYIRTHGAELVKNMTTDNAD